MRETPGCAEDYEVGGRYGWIREWRNGLIVNAYCLTLIQNMAPATVLDGLGAARRRVMSLDELQDASGDMWTISGGDHLVVGVTSLASWTLMFEDDGYVGITTDLILPLSPRRTIVSHYRNVNALSRFVWIDDGEIATSFETLFPRVRSGSRADLLDDDLRQAGFDLSEGALQPDPTEAAFALAEQITGVAIMHEMLEGPFEGGVVTLADGALLPPELALEETPGRPRHVLADFLRRRTDPSQ